MSTSLTVQRQYDIPARRIAGTHEERLDQIDQAIQELLEVKLLECAGDRPDLRFLAVPRRSHWLGMTVTLALLLVTLLLLLGVRSAHAQAAGTAENPADEAWKRVKFGAAFEGYYQYAWNVPPDRSIPLRAYDVLSNSFSLQQIALVVDAPPEPARDRRLGLRVDLQFGQATGALQGSPANEPRPDVYRNLWQAYGTYVFPVGRGLQLDFGKFASNLGYESNYAKDDFNFSRGLLYGALPAYHTGLRTTLPVTDTLSVAYMLTNGIQQAEDFNGFKSSQVSVVAKPFRRVSTTASYYAGREQPDGGAADGPDGWFRVADVNVTVAASRRLTAAVDAARTSNQAQAGGPALTLTGLAAYARHQLSSAFAAAIRYEHLDDSGLLMPVAQRLQELTTTAEYRLAEGFLVRGEWRRDWSNVAAFASQTSRHQTSLLAGLVWWIGSKEGGW